MKITREGQSRTVETPASVVNFAIFFILLVCLLFAANDLLQLGRARFKQLSDTDIALNNMARALTQHADDTVKSADASLLSMVDIMETFGDGPHPDLPGRLARLMAREAGTVDQVQAYFVFDERGRLLIDSTSQYVRQAITDREYFRFHRDHTSRDVHIGPLINNRITGTWIISVSRRYNHADGSFAGLVVAAVDIEYFKAYYSTFDIGVDGIILLGLNDGTILVRRPLYERYVGTGLAPVPLYRDHIAKLHNGTVEFTSFVDGEQRLGAYRHSDRYPVFVFAALSKNEVLANWRRDAAIHIAGMVILMAALLFLGLRLVRQIKLRARTEISLVQTRDSLNERNETLSRLALEDGLTALANRRHFDLAIEQELGRAIHNCSAIALIMLDVDYFKQYNDIYGHTAGDACLRRVGAVLKTLPQRPGDIAARYGGDEFVLLLPGANLTGACKVAEQLRHAILELGLTHAANHAGQVTVSIGVAALCPASPGQDVTGFVALADSALYRAKSLGRNRIAREPEAAAMEGEGSSKDEVDFFN